MRFEFWPEAYKFIGIFFFLLLVPCIGIAIIGYRMIDKLGHFPSKTPAIQLSIFLQLVATEVISFGLILLAYQIVSTANN